MRGGLHLDGLLLEPEGWAARVRVPAGAPIFDGHFPDHPLLPGVAVPLMVADVAGEAAGLELVPVRLRRVRFLAPVRPGATLRVGLAAERFTVHEGDALVADGAIALAPVSSTVDRDTAWPEGVGTSPSLPHAGPARLVERVQEGRALARIPAASPLAVDGRVPACVVLEAAAQGAGGTAAPAGASREGGMLVRVAEAFFPAATLRVCAAFDLEVASDGEAPPLRLFRATSPLGGEAAALRFAVREPSPS